jgi:hypothetical protein
MPWGKSLDFYEMLAKILAFTNGKECEERDPENPALSASDIPGHKSLFHRLPAARF